MYQLLTIEMAFALDYLNYFLLTHPMLEALNASSSARIDFDEWKRKYSGFKFKISHAG